MDDVFFAFGLGIAVYLIFHINRFLSLIVTLNHVSIKFLLGFLIHHFIGIIIDILFFLYFFRMIHYHIGLEIKLRDVHSYIILVIHGLVHVLFELVLKVGVYGVVE